MVENSSIEWTTHTFNPWWGCTKISEGCRHCYANTFAKRVGQDVWGADADRRLFGEKHWREPVRWNEEARGSRRRPRVFCASMADVFEDRRDLDAERAKLWPLIESCTRLDWLLLTKRPDVMRRLLPWQGSPLRHVWAGTTVEDQRAADTRIPVLREIGATIRFLSVEPLIGPVRIDDWSGINWAIIGGESGPSCRPCEVSWIGDLVESAKSAGVAIFVKQVGAKPTVGGVRLPIVDSKGGALRDIPKAMRIREAPHAA